MIPLVPLHILKSFCRTLDPQPPPPTNRALPNSRISPYSPATGLCCKPPKMACEHSLPAKSSAFLRILLFVRPVDVISIKSGSYYPLLAKIVWSCLVINLKTPKYCYLEYILLTCSSACLGLKHRTRHVKSPCEEAEKPAVAVSCIHIHNIWSTFCTLEQVKTPSGAGYSWTRNWKRSHVTLEYIHISTLSIHFICQCARRLNRSVVSGLMSVCFWQHPRMCHPWSLPTPIMVSLSLTVSQADKISHICLDPC